MDANFLKGIKIIDATRVLAGPFCTLILSDLGATVLKIEMPERGDETRHYSPFIKDESAYFLSVNRNKKSICLDFKNREDRKILKNLVEDADVFIHNYTPITSKKLKIDYDTIKKWNSNIIYISITGFGMGPYKDFLGYDILIQGMSGLLSVTGTDEENLCRVGNSTIDIYAGYMSAIMILTSLFSRDIKKNNRSVKIEIPLLDTAIYSMTYLLGYYSATGEDPKPMGIAHPGIVPYQLFKTKDKPIIIAVANDKQFVRLCKVIGREDLSLRPEFSTNFKRVKNRDELTHEIQKIIKSMSSNYWLSLFRANNVPAGPIYKISDILKDEHIKYRKTIIKKNFRGKNILMAAFPAMINNKRYKFFRSSPPILCDSSKE